MSLVNVPQVNPNDEITAEAQNAQVNAIATVVNGNIDDDNVSQLSGSKLAAGTTPATAMTDSGNVEKRFDETFSDYVMDGCVWSALSGLNGTMTTGTISVQGKRLTAPAVATRAFTASKDTYVYLDASGLPVYTGEVANGAAAPTQPANTVRTYKVVTSASAITSVTDIRSKPVGLKDIDWPMIGYFNRAWGTPTRANNIVYTNSNSYPIDVAIIMSRTTKFSIVAALRIDGAIRQRMTTNDSDNGVAYDTFYTTIPAGSTYQLQVTVGTIDLWSELA